MPTLGNLRAGGRANAEIRELTISHEGLDRVDGSARFGFGETQALASLSGPIEVRLALEHPSRATLEVILRPLSTLPGTESKALASTIRNLLTPSLLLTVNPRSLLQLVVQSLCLGVGTKGKGVDPGLVAAMINASTLAFMNAGSVPMKGVVCAVAVGRFPSTPSSSPILVLDPSDAELPTLQGGGCFAFIFSSTSSTPSSEKNGVPKSDLVYSSWQATTPFAEEELVQARELAREGAGKVWTAMKESVRHGTKASAPFAFEKGKRSAKEKVETMKVSGSEKDSTDDEMEI